MAKQVVNVGAGIVADSNPAAEYEETLAKAAGFLAALKVAKRRMEISPAQRAGIIVPK
jgi:anthranilate/para-aminobenzoate synthase component I